MSTTALEHLFTTKSIWESDVAPQIRVLRQDMFRRGLWFSSQSRTLTNALTRVFSQTYQGPTYAIQTLYAMCALLNDNKKLNIYPKYLNISSEESETLRNNFHEYLHLPTISQQEFNLILYHIPRGKSYIKPILDENPDHIRLKQIETFCITGPQHFIRIYRNFLGTGLNTITIFSDQCSEYLLYTLWAMLPHLMDIHPLDNAENDPKETEIHNHRVETLYRFFEIFFGILRNTRNTAYDTTAELRTLIADITRISTHYAKQFDFVTGMLGSFTKRLAKVKNNTAQTYYDTELTKTNRTINDYERRLEEEYNRKRQLERSLLANKLLSEEDLAPFMQTLTSTKAIEITRTTDTEMTLKITAPLQYFQSSDFEAYENNPKSIYNTNYATLPLHKRILHKLFVTREYKILFQAIIYMRIRENYADTPLEFTTERSNLDIYSEFPNPHLYHYDCWGAAKNEMKKNINEGNYELVVMQMVAAVQTMNIAEQASFINGFLSDIKDSTRLKRLATFIVETPEGPLKLNLDQMLEYEENLQKTETIQKAEETIKNNPEQYTQIEIPDDDANWE